MRLSATRNRRRRGFSLMEMLIVVAIIMILAVIIVPKVSTAMMSTREMAAVRQITTVNTAQIQYMSQFGRYATSLAELGPPPASGQPGPAGADLIPADFAQGVRSGYQFILQGSPTGYTVNANPVTPGTTGRRTFYSDQTGVIRENWGTEPANVSSKELK